MKKILTIALGAFVLSACGESNDSVLIGGVEWATRNVGEPGKFVDSPSDKGGLFTFEEAQTACPAGWRVPTPAELKVLAIAGSVWEFNNGTEGRTFGKEKQTIFLPAASAVPFFPKDKAGYYWSDTKKMVISGYCLSFNAGSRVDPDDYQVDLSKFSVRCVRAE